MASFATDITAFAKKTSQTMDSAVREVVMELASEVVLRSPVGDKERWAINLSRASRGLQAIPEGYVGGHFRANNQYHFGSVPQGEINGVDTDGGKTVAAVRAGVYSSQVAGVHYIVNNVPYALPLENGHSNQAPQGIYGLSMLTVLGKLNAIVSKAARNSK
jgi:hypothetical protein